MTVGNFEVSWKTVQTLSSVVRRSQTVKATKATVGINTYGGQHGHRRVMPQTSWQNRARMGSPGGFQRRSATRWLEMKLHAEDTTDVAGRPIWTCEVRSVCHEGGWVIQRQQDVADQLFLVGRCWWGHAGGWCNGLFQALSNSHLSQVTHRKSWFSCRECYERCAGQTYASVCLTSLFLFTNAIACLKMLNILHI